MSIPFITHCKECGTEVIPSVLCPKCTENQQLREQLHQSEAREHELQKQLEKANQTIQELETNSKVFVESYLQAFRVQWKSEELEQYHGALEKMLLGMAGE